MFVACSHTMYRKESRFCSRQCHAQTWRTNDFSLNRFFVSSFGVVECLDRDRCSAQSTVCDHVGVFCSLFHNVVTVESDRFAAAQLHCFIFVNLQDKKRCTLNNLRMGQRDRFIKIDRSLFGSNSGASAKMFCCRNCVYL